MVRHRERVEGAQRLERHPDAANRARSRARVAGSQDTYAIRLIRPSRWRRSAVGDGADSSVDDRPGGSGSRRVEHGQRGAGQPVSAPAPPPHRRGAPGPTASPAGCAWRRAPPAASASIPITVPDGPTAPARTPANSPAPQYRSSAMSPGCGPQRVEHGGGERVRRLRMDLPEPGRADPPVPPGGPLAQVAGAARHCGPAHHGVRRRSGCPAHVPVDDHRPLAGARARRRPRPRRRPARLAGSPPAAVTSGCAIGQSPTSMTSCERCLCRPATPSRPTANLTLVRQPRPVSSPGSGSTMTSRSMPGDPPQLLADDRGLQRALGRQAGVLPVAAAAAARARVRARRPDPVCRGIQDLRRVGPGELGRGLGDHRADPLSGQRVPDEDHRPGGQPGHAPAAVRDLADGELDSPARAGRRGCARLGARCADRLTRTHAPVAARSGGIAGAHLLDLG